MCRCESWTIKKAEGQRIDAFELWCWRRLLRVPWTAWSQSYRKSALNIHWKDWCWSSNNFGHLMWRTDSLEESLVLGKTEGRRRSGRHRMRSLNGITNWTNMSLSKLQEIVKDGEAWLAAVRGLAKSWARLWEWTTILFETPALRIKLTWNGLTGEKHANLLTFRYLWKWKLLSCVRLFVTLYSPWNSPGQNTVVGSPSLLQGIFPTQGSNPGLSHCRWILYQLSYQRSLRILEWVAYPFSSRSSQPRNRTRVSRFFTSWAIILPNKPPAQ